MANPISLFSGYSQNENRTTNYCLLLLRMLYEANPKFLEEALGAITEGQIGTVGVEFSQQERQSSGIPDGVIRQAPFTVFIETKSFDWFYDSQLERHLQDLNEQRNGQKILLALSAFPDGYEQRFDRIETLCRDKYDGKIAFAALSFEEFVDAVRVDGLPKTVSDYVDELEEYLDQNSLLPDWKYKLDVCNCSRALPDQEDHHVYICPASGGPYKHRRCRYFGAYKNRAAQYIAEIAGIVDFEVGDEPDGVVLWNNRPDLYTNDELIVEAQARKEVARPDTDYSTRVFVLEDLTKTNFIKESGPPMRGSKQYFDMRECFDVRELNANSAEELARALDGKKWKNFA